MIKTYLFIFILSTISMQASIAAQVDPIQECQRYLNTSSRWDQWAQEVGKFRNKNLLDFDYHYTVGKMVYQEFSGLIPDFNNQPAEEAFNAKRKATFNRELTVREADQFLDQLGFFIQGVANEAHRAKCGNVVPFKIPTMPKRELN